MPCVTSPSTLWKWIPTVLFAAVALCTLGTLGEADPAPPASDDPSPIVPRVLEPSDLPGSLRGFNPDHLSSGLLRAIVEGTDYATAPSHNRHGRTGNPEAAFDDSGLQSLAPWIGRNTRLGDDPSALPGGNGRNQAEPHIFRSPSQPDVLLATFQEGRFPDGGAYSNGYAVSRDGGFNWTRALNPNLTQIGGGSAFRGTDPVAAIDLEGRFFLNSLVALDDEFNAAQVVIQRSDDQGENWTPPLTIYTPNPAPPLISIFPDKNWLTVNTYSNSAYRNRLLATWTDFRTVTTNLLPAQNFLVRASVSDDAGETWSPAGYVTPPSVPESPLDGFQGSQPLFLPEPDGAVVVVMFSFANSNASSFGSFVAAHSIDGGATFSPFRSSILAGVQPYTDNQIRNGSFLPSAAVARETGQVFVAVQVSDVNDGSRILVIRSESQEFTGPVPQWTWSAPVRVDPPDAIGVAMTPTIAVSPLGNYIAVSYLVRENPASSQLLHVHLVESFDGGISWSSPTRVSEDPIDPTRSTWTARGWMLGDYFAMAQPDTGDESVLPIWIGTSEGNADPWTARVGSRGNGQDWFQGWLSAHFNSEERSNLAPDPVRSDFDRDDRWEFVELALGSDPRTPDIFPPNSDASFIVGELMADSVPALASLRLESDVSLPRGDGMVSGFDRVFTGDGTEFWRSIQFTRSGPGGDFQSLQVVPGSDAYSSGNFSLNSAPYPFRSTETFDEGLAWSRWFGWFDDSDWPWLWHWGLGWLFVGSSDGFDTWFYSPELGWLFIRDSIYPALFASDRGEYLYFDTTSGPSAPRRFYSWILMDWIEL